MKRDIDEIISALREKLPEVNVVQLAKVHPADDDGLWWFRLPGVQKDIQVESSTGNCPFMVESDDDASALEALNAETVEEVISTVMDYLTCQRRL